MEIRYPATLEAQEDGTILVQFVPLQRAMANRATEDERLSRLTAICLAFPEVIRNLRGDHADFRVRKKVFAYFLDNHHGDGIVSVCVKSSLGENVERARAMPELYYLPAYIGHQGWFGMRLDVGEIDWQEVETIVERSYRLAAPKTLAKLVGAAGSAEYS